MDTVASQFLQENVGHCGHGGILGSAEQGGIDGPVGPAGATSIAASSSLISIVEPVDCRRFRAVLMNTARGATTNRENGLPR